MGRRARIKKARSANGTCYQDAGRFALDAAMAKEPCWLVHGTVFSRCLNRRINHAWIIIPKGTLIEGPDGSIKLDDDTVLDLTLPDKFKLVPKVVYYKVIGRALDEQVYTEQEARRYAVTFKHWGPWPQGPLPQLWKEDVP